MESYIECGIEGISQVVNVKTLLIIILDGFDGRQFTFIDPVHELPRSLFFVSDSLFLDIFQFSRLLVIL